MSIQSVPFPARLELAFGSNPNDAEATWIWTDVSNRLRSQTVDIKRGQADESRQIQPANISLKLNNLDGELTPTDPRSSFWPDVRRQVPLRLSVPDTENRLVLPGTAGDNASTPDDTALDITGDIDIRVQLSPDDWTPSSFQNIISKFTDPSQHSWRWFFTNTGFIRFEWSEDGTSTLTATSTETTTFGVDETQWLRVTLDVDNGGSENDVTMYISADGISWTQLGDVITQVGVTSIFNSTAAVEIGETTSTAGLIGEVRKAEIRDGIDGTVVANPNFSAQTTNTTMFTDAAGRTWTINGDASISEVAFFNIRFIGHVDEIKPRWTLGSKGDRWVDVVASGVTRRLTQGAKRLNSALFRRITDPLFTDAVLAYWPAEDGNNAAELASAIESVPSITFTGSLQLAADSSLMISNSLPRVEAGTTTDWSVAVPAPEIFTFDWIFSMVVNIPTLVVSPADTELVTIYTTGGDVASWEISVNDARLQWRGFDADGSLISDNSSSTNIEDFGGGWTHLSFEVSQDGTDVRHAMWWEPLERVGPDGVGVTGTVLNATIGIPSLLAASVTGPPDDLSFGHISIARTPPSGDPFFGFGFGWYTDAGGSLILQAFEGETAADRIQRLSTEEQVPIEIIGDPAESERMGPQRPGKFLRLIQDCVDADLGVLIERRDHVGFSYRTRQTLYNQEFILTLNANTLTTPFQPTLDDQQFVNDVEVTRENGASERVIDQASINADNRYSDSITLNIFSDEQLVDQANWRLHLGTFPGMRYPSVSPQLTLNETRRQDWLQLGLGDRVELDELPEEHPLDTVNLLVTGISETFNEFTWMPSFNASPADPWDVGTLEPASGPTVDIARLDSDASELELAIDDTETTLLVLITEGPLWTTVAAQLGFGILVGGEEMTVTAVSGATSPQSFTVTRAVNGVVKSHAAGTAVNVVNPLVLAW